MTLFLKTFFALCLFVLGAGVAHAQCAPGMIPYSGTDINSCGPDPNYNQQQAPQAQAPRRNPALWGDPNAKSTLPHGWTASVAAHDKPMAMSFSKGMPNRRAAIDAAMADCRRKGATRCDLIAAVKAP